MSNPSIPAGVRWNDTPEGLRFHLDGSFVESTEGASSVRWLDEWRDEPADYHDQLAELAAADVLMHCLNPDRIVIHRGRREPCAGALADLYEALGGRVCWYGKPHAPIYDHAIKLAGHPPRSAVLAIGDGLVTDMLGAARYGIDAVFVSDGINAGQPVPSEFASRYDLGDWQPRLTVSDLS